MEAFGEAMMRGMGWVEGRGIGRHAERAVEAVEFVARPPQLGLGATPSLAPRKEKRVIRQGETRGPKPDLVYINAEGVQKNVKTLDAKLVEREKKGAAAGKTMRVVAGAHAGLLCEVLAVEPQVAPLISLTFYLYYPTLILCSARAMCQPCQRLRAAGSQRAPARRQAPLYSWSLGCMRPGDRLYLALLSPYSRTRPGPINIAASLQRARQVAERSQRATVRLQPSAQAVSVRVRELGERWESPAAAAEDPDADGGNDGGGDRGGGGAREHANGSEEAGSKRKHKDRHRHKERHRERVGGADGDAKRGRRHAARCLLPATLVHGRRHVVLPAARVQGAGTLCRAGRAVQPVA